VREFCEAVVKVISLYSEMPTLTDGQRQTIARLFESTRNLAQLETECMVGEEWLGTEFRDAAKSLAHSYASIRTILDGATPTAAGTELRADSQRCWAALLGISQISQAREAAARVLVDNAQRALAAARADVAAFEADMLKPQPAVTPDVTPEDLALAEEETALRAEESQLANAVRGNKRRRSEMMEAKLDTDEKVDQLRRTQRDLVDHSKSRQSSSAKLLRSTQEDCAALEQL
jgi:hypothetical protein